MAPHPPPPKAGHPRLLLRFQVRALGTLHTHWMAWLISWAGGPMGPVVTLSQPQLLRAPRPSQLADSSDFMAPDSVPNRWHLLPHLPESWPRARWFHRPHFCFCQRCGCGHAHRGLCGDRAGSAPGEAGLNPGQREPAAYLVLCHPTCARPSCSFAQLPHQKSRPQSDRHGWP